MRLSIYAYFQTFWQMHLGSMNEDNLCPSTFFEIERDHSLEIFVSPLINWCGYG